jgi:NitT/TauT family transport system substrate-binding protein
MFYPGARLLGTLAILAALGVGCTPAAPAAAPVRATATAAPPAASAPTAPAAAQAPGTASGTTAPAGGAGVTARPGLAGLPPRPDRPVAKVTVGILGTTSDVIFYLAEEKGYFEHLRIEPVFERFDSGGRMISSLATNQIDVGGGSPSVGLYRAMARNVDVRIVADRASSAPGHNSWHLFVRKELADSGAIRGYGDLRGRRLAVAARGTSADVLLGRALEQAGLTIADVDLVEMPYPDMAAAMATGVIDAAISPEPFVSVAVQRGGAVKWKGSQEIVPNQVASTLMYTSQLVEQRPDVARDFMTVYLQGARDYNDAFMKKLPQALAEAQDTILRRTDLRDPELLQRVEPAYVSPNDVPDRAALLADYQWFRQHGGLTESINLDQYIDDSFVKHAVSVLGTYR